jgi:hypothetical protein
MAGYRKIKRFFPPPARGLYPRPCTCTLVLVAFVRLTSWLAHLVKVVSQVTVTEAG